MAASTWSEGYLTGSGYSHGYYRALDPRHAAFSMLLERLEGPPAGPCCELGYGQGLSLAMHAAGDPSRQWWGTDFMPGHAAQTRGLVHAAGVNAVISDQGFEEFFARADLPQFAFVGLHGVWSWVSPANRARIVEFLRRQLMPGGVVYLSYNSLPGWAAALPVRQLMLNYHHRATASGRPDGKRLGDALAFAQKVLSTDPKLAALAPALHKQVADWANEPPAYLLHELLHDHFHPMDFSQVAAELDIAKLSYVASSDPRDRQRDLQYSPAQRELLTEIEDPVLRESAQDVFVARRFRSEYWVRGGRPLSQHAAARRMRAQHVVLGVARDKVPTGVVGVHGKAPLPEKSLALVLDRLEQANAPVEMGQLLDQGALAGIEANELVATLVGVGALLLAGPPEEIEAARAGTRRLNRYLIAEQTHHSEIACLASAVSGGGVSVTASMRLMLAARADAPAQPEHWADLAWRRMQAEGQHLMADDKRVTDRAIAARLLQPMVDTLQDRTLPRLRRLGVTD